MNKMTFHHIANGEELRAPDVMFENVWHGTTTGSQVKSAQQSADDAFSEHTFKNVVKTTCTNPPVIGNRNPLAMPKLNTFSFTGSIDNFRTATTITEPSPIRTHAANGIIRFTSAAGDNIPATLFILAIKGRVVSQSRVSYINNKPLMVYGFVSGIYIAVTEKKTAIDRRKDPYLNYTNGEIRIKADGADSVIFPIKRKVR